MYHSQFRLAFVKIYTMIYCQNLKLTLYDLNDRGSKESHTINNIQDIDIWNFLHHETIYTRVELTLYQILR